MLLLDKLKEISTGKHVSLILNGCSASIDKSLE